MQIVCKFIDTENDVIMSKVIISECLHNVLLSSVLVVIQGFALVIESVEFLRNAAVIMDYALNDLYTSLFTRAGP
jgi:hypothetical protein